VIDLIWNRILKYEGEVFRQLRGKEFTYNVVGNSIVPSTTNRNIHIGQFEKALSFLPLDGTKDIQHLQGPSYIYAILMDNRVRDNY
jgi:hypothetical protein